MLWFDCLLAFNMEVNFYNASSFTRQFCLICEFARILMDEFMDHTRNLVNMIFKRLLSNQLQIAILLHLDWLLAHLNQALVLISPVVCMYSSCLDTKLCVGLLASDAGKCSCHSSRFCCLRTPCVSVCFEYDLVQCFVWFRVSACCLDGCVFILFVVSAAFNQRNRPNASRQLESRIQQSNDIRQSRNNLDNWTETWLRAYRMKPTIFRASCFVNFCEEIGCTESWKTNLVGIGQLLLIQGKHFGFGQNFSEKWLYI